jgi:hypothetical protein
MMECGGCGGIAPLFFTPALEWCERSALRTCRFISGETEVKNSGAIPSFPNTCSRNGAQLSTDTAFLFLCLVVSMLIAVRRIPNAV